MLPLRPGLYTWLVRLYDDQREIDSWYTEPEMTISTQSHQAVSDDWTGILNMPASLAAQPRTLSESASAGSRGGER
jgi:hypothetical protein